MMDVETFPILDDVELPPKGAAARFQKTKVSLETTTENIRFNISDNLRRLFSTPSLMKDEDPTLYFELYRLVEEVVQPKNVCEQMMVADITNHFWEQQRYRRCTGTSYQLQATRSTGKDPPWSDRA